MTRRTQRPDRAGSELPDYAPLIRSLIYLDEALKRGVVISVDDDCGELTVDSSALNDALAGVRNQIANVQADMERLVRTVGKFYPASAALN